MPRMMAASSVNQIDCGLCSKRAHISYILPLRASALQRGPVAQSTVLAPGAAPASIPRIAPSLHGITPSPVSVFTAASYVSTYTLTTSPSVSLSPLLPASLLSKWPPLTHPSICALAVSSTDSSQLNSASPIQFDPKSTPGRVALFAVLAILRARLLGILRPSRSVTIPALNIGSAALQTTQDLVNRTLNVSLIMLGGARQASALRVATQSTPV
ncbi:hypothetical protein B0H17DRAFT_1218880 [Mycena rosella]|uniref:Uncharacterized protein n=1 Tax=Mycena rosella TaxID=1033263 RepID=A0AAD7BME1_MYCRO|nr:hypothetical protein B0H17DRAFT_1218880 [Mycena rosella]